MPPKAGIDTAAWHLDVEKAAKFNAPIIRCDVVVDQGRELVVKFFSATDIAALGGVGRLDLALTALEFGIQARCFSHGGALITCEIAAWFVGA